MEVRDVNRRFQGVWAKILDAAGQSLGIIHIGGIDYLGDRETFKVFGELYTGKGKASYAELSLDEHHLLFDFPMATYRNVGTTTTYLYRNPSRQWVRGLSFGPIKVTTFGGKAVNSRDIAWSVWNPEYENVKVALAKVDRNKAISRALTNNVRINKQPEVTLPTVEVRGVLVGVIREDTSVLLASPEFDVYVPDLRKAGIFRTEVLR